MSFWHSHDFTVQRCAYLIGYVKEEQESFADEFSMNAGNGLSSGAKEPNKRLRAVVEAVYEPRQKCDGEAPIITESPEERAKMDKLLAALGLRRVGWVFTSLPREELLTPGDVLRIGRLQVRACACVRVQPQHTNKKQHQNLRQKIANSSKPRVTSPIKPFPHMPAGRFARRTPSTTQATRLHRSCPRRVDRVSNRTASRKSTCSKSLTRCRLC